MISKVFSTLIIGAYLGYYCTVDAGSTYAEDVAVSSYTLPPEEYSPYPSYHGAKVSAARFSSNVDAVRCHETLFTPENSILKLANEADFDAWVQDDFEFELIYAGSACDDLDVSSDVVLQTAINATVAPEANGKQFAWVMEANPECEVSDMAWLAQSRGAKAVFVVLQSEFESDLSDAPAPTIPFTTVKTAPSVTKDDFTIPTCALSLVDGTRVVRDIGFAKVGLIDSLPEGTTSLFTKIRRFDQRIYVAGPQRPRKALQVIPIQVFSFLSGQITDGDDRLQSLEIEFLAPKGLHVNVDLVKKVRPTPKDFGLRIVGNWVTDTTIVPVPPGDVDGNGGDAYEYEVLQANVLSKLYDGNILTYTPEADVIDGDIYFIRVSAVDIPGAYSVGLQAVQFFTNSNDYRFVIDGLDGQHRLPMTIGNYEETFTWTTYQGETPISLPITESNNIISQVGYVLSYQTEDGNEITFDKRGPFPNHGTADIKFGVPESDLQRMELPGTVSFVTLRGANKDVPIVGRFVTKLVRCNLQMHSFSSLGFVAVAKRTVDLKFSFNMDSSAKFFKFTLWQTVNGELKDWGEIVTLDRDDIDATTQVVDGVQVVTRPWDIPDREGSGYSIRIESFGEAQLPGGCGSESSYPFSIVSPRLAVVQSSVPEKVYVLDSIKLEWEASTNSIKRVDVHVLHDNSIVDTLSPEDGFDTATVNSVEWMVPESDSILPDSGYRLQVVTEAVANANSILRANSRLFKIVKRGLYHTGQAPVMEALSDGYHFKLEWNPDGVAAHTVDCRLMCEWQTDGSRTLSKVYNVRLVGDSPTSAEGVIPVSFLESGHKMNCHFVVQSRVNLDYLLEFTETEVKLVSKEEFAPGKGGTPNSEGTFTGGEGTSTGSGDFGTMVGAFVVAGLVILSGVFMFTRYRRRKERSESELPWDVRDTAATSPRHYQNQLDEDNDTVEMQSW